MVDKKKETLETLGTILDGEAKRDAIHIAVAPVVAQETLWPGENVGADGTTNSTLVGIVDPFLKDRVKKGERFWLFIYPKKIDSLRHVWTHPEFADESTLSEADELKVAQVIDNLDGSSRKWIEEFADKLGRSYDQLMKDAEVWLTTGEYIQDNSESYKSYYDEFEEFWERYEKITGKKVLDGEKESFFTCSC